MVEVVFTIALIPIILSFVLMCEMRVMLLVTIVAIFFPVHIEVMGRDALTSGTVLILLLYAKYFIISNIFLIRKIFAK